MTRFEKLIAFEEKYPSLYDIKCNGMPIYTVLREQLLKHEPDKESKKTQLFDSVAATDTYISVRRILDSLFKWKKYKKADTLIFSSSLFRRDKNQNLGVEYLLEKYPGAIVYEWPNHNKKQDNAYRSESNVYVPIDWYLVLYKVSRVLNRKQYTRYYNECLDKLNSIFTSEAASYNAWICMLRNELPQSYADTMLSQDVFKKMFKGCSGKHIIDFFGSARENIAPVIPNSSVTELQHGIITSTHDGYIYPSYLKNQNIDLFKREILVYGQSTKDILCKNSIFTSDQIEIIGNPRILMYRRLFEAKDQKRKYLLFSSQPYDDPDYYSLMIEYMSSIKKYIAENAFYRGYQLAIKLHPREDSSVEKLYRNALGDDVCTFGNDSELYEILMQSYLHFTATSTVLYEATEFGCPTVVFQYAEYRAASLFGDNVLEVEQVQEVYECLNILSSYENYEKYLNYLKSITKIFM